jgi:hypothetical protein
MKTNRWLAAALITIFLFASPLAILGQSPELRQITVDHLTITKLSPLEALLALGNQLSIPLGIAISDKSLYESKINHAFIETTVGTAIDQILSTAPQYTSHEEHGVIMIGVGNDLDRNPVLHYLFPRFRTFQAMGITDVSEAIWGNMQLSLNPKRTGYGGVLRVPPLDKQKLPVIDESNVSIGELLDKVVAARGDVAWISWAPPATLIDAPQYRLWNFVFYTGADIQAEKLCCIYPPSDLTDMPADVRSRLTQ